MSAGRLIRLVAAACLLLAGVVVVATVGLVATNPAPRESDGWSLASPLPEARGEIASAVADGRLYVIGGLAGSPPRTADDVSIYEPAADAWQAGPPLPEPRHHTAAAGLEGSVYVSGGAASLTDWAPTDSLWRLAGGTGEWQPLTPMPEPRYGHRMVAFDGLLYVVGGQGGSGAVQVYDPAGNHWVLAAPIPSVRDHLAVAVADGQILAIGGRDGGLTARVDIYDPASDSWREGPSLPAPTSGAAEAAGEGLVLISGGEDPSPTGEGVFDRHWWLDVREPSAGWHELTAPPLAVHGAQGALIGGRFYIPGGATRAGGMSFLAWSDALQVLDLAGVGPE